MSKGQTVILAGPYQRALAMRMVALAPDRAVLTISEEKRSNDQNAKMWAMLSDISRAKPEGRKLPTEKWKALFMDAAGQKVDWEPGLDGNGVVPVGYRSSRLTKAEMSDVIECIYEYGSRHGVLWSEPTIANDERAA